MRRVVLVSLLAIGCASARGADQSPILAKAITEISISPAGDMVVFVSSDPPAIVVRDRNAVVFSEAIDASIAVSSISWSFDSKYAAVEYESGDTTGIKVLHIDSRATPIVRIVDIGSGYGGKWIPGTHEMLFAPQFDIDELPTKPGMVRVDVETKKRTTILENYYFWGRHDVSGSTFVAQAIQYDDIRRPQFFLVRMNLGTLEVAVAKSVRP